MLSCRAGSDLGVRCDGFGCVCFEPSECRTNYVHVYIHMLLLTVFFLLEYVSSICFSPMLTDVCGSIGGRSGDLTNVGRVARVWVETKWGQRDDPR